MIVKRQNKNRLILATGSNLGDSKKNLLLVKEYLSQHFDFIAQSQIVQSQAVDYLEQPDFFNQVLEFQTQLNDAHAILKITQYIEKEVFKRHKTIDKGPRIIDIDIIFFEDHVLQTPDLTLPHPEFSKRWFVKDLLSELPSGEHFLNLFLK